MSQSTGSRWAKLWNRVVLDSLRRASRADRPDDAEEILNERVGNAVAEDETDDRITTVRRRTDEEWTVDDDIQT